MIKRECKKVSDLFRISKKRLFAQLAKSHIPLNVKIPKYIIIAGIVARLMLDELFRVCPVKMCWQLILWWENK